MARTKQKPTQGRLQEFVNKHVRNSLPGCPCPQCAQNGKLRVAESVNVDITHMGEYWYMHVEYECPHCKLYFRDEQRQYQKFNPKNRISNGVEK